MDEVFNAKNMGYESAQLKDIRYEYNFRSIAYSYLFCLDINSWINNLSMFFVIFRTILAA